MPSASSVPVLELSPVTAALRETLAANHELASRVAREHHFNLTDSMALEILDRRGPLGAAELARALGIRSASVTVLVDRLEQAGYVRRQRDPVDRRRVTITAQPEALAGNLALWLPSIVAVDQVARELDVADREVVERYLAAVTRAMADQPAPAAEALEDTRRTEAG